MSEILEPISSIDEIPAEMSDEEAAEFYGSHDLSNVWDELEPLDESMGVSDTLQERMVGIRLEPRHLQLVKRVAEQDNVPYRTLMTEWVSEKAEDEAEKRGLSIPA